MARASVDSVAARSFRLTKVGVEFSRAPTPEELVQLGRALTQVANAQPWAWGDFLLAAEHVWGDAERYRAAMAITGQRRAVLAAYVRVAISFRHEERHLAPWPFYQAAAWLPDEERLRAVQRACFEAWSVEQLQRHVREQLGPARPSRPAPVRVVTCPQCGCRFQPHGTVRVPAG